MKMSRLETYEIPLENFSAFVNRIDKLSSRARVLGLDPIGYEELGERSVKQKDGTSYKVIEVALVGERPKLNGWRFIARIDHGVDESDDEANIIAKSPFCEDIDEIPKEYRTAEPKCDHCELLRYRKNTFLLINEEGEWKQVGSTCLKDFTGHADPHAIAAWLEDIKALRYELRASDDMLGGVLGGSKYLDTLDFLTIVAAVIDEYGWVSRKNANRVAGNWPTADVAIDIIMDLKDKKDVEIEINDDHKETAKAALKWCDEVLGTRTSLNDFESNLVTLCRRDIFNWEKYSGFVAALIIVWQRETQKAEALRKQGMTSEHVGEVGDRETFKLIPTKVMEFGGVYGKVYLHILEDYDGNVFVWKTSTTMLERGIAYEISGTIVEHKHYDNIPQTHISNCRNVKVWIPERAQPAVLNRKEGDETVLWSLNENGDRGMVWKHTEFDVEKSRFHKNWIFVPDSHPKAFYRMQDHQFILAERVEA
jgi:hypothetical protein